MKKLILLTFALLIPSFSFAESLRITVNVNNKDNTAKFSIVSSKGMLVDVSFKKINKIEYFFDLNDGLINTKENSEVLDQVRVLYARSFNVRDKTLKFEKLEKILPTEIVSTYLEEFIIKGYSLTFFNGDKINPLAINTIYSWHFLKCNCD